MTRPSVSVGQLYRWSLGQLSLFYLVVGYRGLDEQGINVWDVHWLPSRDRDYSFTRVLTDIDILTDDELVSDGGT